MKVIFLDIDGVLNLIPQGRDEFGGIFHQHLVDNLKRLVDETGAKLVISSTWRFDGLKRMREMWEKRGYPGDIIGVTPHVDICKRGEEIKKWMKYFYVSNYVILDDDTDMLEEQLENFVRTSENRDHRDCVDIGYGLTSICTDKAIEILNRK